MTSHAPPCLLPTVAKGHRSLFGQYSNTLPDIVQHNHYEIALSLRTQVIRCSRTRSTPLLLQRAAARRSDQLHGWRDWDSIWGARRYIQKKGAYPEKVWPASSLQRCCRSLSKWRRLGRSSSTLLLEQPVSRASPAPLTARAKAQAGGCPSRRSKSVLPAACMTHQLSVRTPHGAEGAANVHACCRWENALIGWTSTADPLHSVAANTLNFFTKEEAEAFCKKHGWAYEVLPPKLQTETRPKRFIGYGDNYRCAVLPSPVTEAVSLVMLQASCFLWACLHHTVCAMQCQAAWIPARRVEVGAHRAET